MEETLRANAAEIRTAIVEATRATHEALGTELRAQQTDTIRSLASLNDSLGVWQQQQQAERPGYTGADTEVPALQRLQEMMEETLRANAAEIRTAIVEATRATHEALGTELRAQQACVGDNTALVAEFKRSQEDLLGLVATLHGSLKETKEISASHSGAWRSQCMQADEFIAKFAELLHGVEKTVRDDVSQQRCLLISLKERVDRGVEQLSSEISSQQIADHQELTKVLRSTSLVGSQTGWARDEADDVRAALQEGFVACQTSSGEMLQLQKHIKQEVLRLQLYLQQLAHCRQEGFEETEQTTLLQMVGEMPTENGSHADTTVPLEAHNAFSSKACVAIVHTAGCQQDDVDPQGKAGQTLMEQHKQTRLLMNIEAIVSTIHKLQLLQEVNSCRRASSVHSPVRQQGLMRPADSEIAAAIQWGR